MASFNERAYFVRAGHAGVQRPDYKPAWEYNPEAARHAADLARKARRRAMWWRLAVLGAYVALAGMAGVVARVVM